MPTIRRWFLLLSCLALLPGQAAAAVLATDDFNRANGAIGSNWTSDNFSGATINVSSNTAVPSALATRVGMHYNAVSFPADQYAQATLTVTGGCAGCEDGPGVGVRMATGTNGYIAQANHTATNNIALAKFVANTRTNLWIRTQAWTDGATFRLEVQGSSLVVKINGVAVGAATTDTALTTGAAGLSYQSTSTTAVWDNWEGGDFAGAGVAPRRRPLYFTQRWPLRLLLSTLTPWLR